MAMRDDLHALIDSLSADEMAQALPYLHILTQSPPTTAADRLAQRMGPATISGRDFMATPPLSLADRAAAQGVRPIASPEALITDIWPAGPGEDPDLFCQTLKQWRQEDGHA